jgi:hypothetical protein
MTRMTGVTGIPGTPQGAWGRDRNDKNDRNSGYLPGSLGAMTEMKRMTGIPGTPPGTYMICCGPVFLLLRVIVFRSTWLSPTAKICPKLHMGRRLLS